MFRSRLVTEYYFGDKMDNSASNTLERAALFIEMYENKNRELGAHLNTPAVYQYMAGILTKSLYHDNLYNILLNLSQKYPCIDEIIYNHQLGSYLSVNKEINFPILSNILNKVME